MCYSHPAFVGDLKEVYYIHVIQETSCSSLLGISEAMIATYAHSFASGK
jgi:hypothetical protein